MLEATSYKELGSLYSTLNQVYTFPTSWCELTTSYLCSLIIWEIISVGDHLILVGIKALVIVVTLTSIVWQELPLETCMSLCQCWVGITISVKFSEPLVLRTPIYFKRQITYVVMIWNPAE